MRRDEHSIYCGVPRLAKGRQAGIRDIVLLVLKVSLLVLVLELALLKK